MNDGTEKTLRDRRFGKRILDLLAPPGIRDESEWLYWRECIVSAVYLAGLVFGPITYFPSLSVVIPGRQWAVFTGATLSLAWTTVAWFLRRRLSLALRTNAALAMIYLLGLTVLVDVGLYSGALAWLFAFGVLCGVMYGPSFIPFALAANACTLAGAGWGIHSGYLQWACLLDHPFARWWVTVINFLLLNTVVAASVAVLTRGLETSLQRERTIRRALEIEKDQIEKAYDRVQAEIRQRERMAQALQESEDRFRRFQEASRGGIVIHDNGVILDANSALAEITGYDLRELIGTDGLRLIAPEWRETVRQRVRMRYSKPYDVMGLKKDGTTYPLEIRGTSLPYRGKTVQVAEFRDITDRKRTEEALRQSEEKYRTTFQNAAHSITITEIETGRFIEVNEGFSRITGYSREEALGNTALDLGLFEDPRDRRFLMDKLRTEGEVTGLPMRYRRKDREIIDTILSAKPMRYEGKDCLVAVAQDVTALRRAEREQARLQAELQQARKMEALGTLAGGIAHDFNNILQAIRGYAQLIVDPGDGGHDSKEYAREIDRSVARASDLIQRLLTFSRKVDPELVPVDINHPVRQSIRILERTIPRMIRIETHLAEDLKPVRADINQIEQVLLNLGTNARDAMPGGGRIAITTENRTVSRETDLPNMGILPPGEYVLLTVSDTGRGMDAETVKNIFDPFFTRKEIGKGTGLGLSMVYGIVQQHGGFIACESEPGRGTTFRIYFPVATEPSRLNGSTSLPSLPARDMEGGEETLLVIDDEEDILEVTARTLERFGYTVFTALNGEEGLEWIESSGEEIDLIILDLSMPGMGGYNTLQRLRTLDPEIKVLIASGYSAEAQREECLAAGAAGFISKPYRIEDLLRSVREILGPGGS